MITQPNQKSNKDYSVKTNMLTKDAIKDIDTSSRIVTGFYNAYNFLDDACDVLVMGACKKSIKERGPKSDAVAKIKHAVDHDLTKLPGKILTLEEKEVDGILGLYFETKMSDTTLGSDTLKNYLAGIYDNHSIGYRVIDWKCVERINEKEWNKAIEGLVNPKAAEGKSCIYLLKEVQLWEGSTVAFGCNELTPFLGMKGLGKDAFKLTVESKLKAFEKTLKSGTQSDEMMESITIQSLQLKQVFRDLLDLIPEEKPEASKGFDAKSFIDSFSLA